MCAGGEATREMANWEKVAGLPQILAAVDGSHIEIQRPQQHQRDYYNRKQFHSIVLQGKEKKLLHFRAIQYGYIAFGSGTVSSDYRFVDIFVGWPGRRHDAYIYQQSSLYKRASEGSLFAG